jgi:copper chaperone CopZ
MAITQLQIARTCAAALVIIGLAPLADGQIAPAAKPVTFEIVADDMCCGGCAKKVAAQLYAAPGVTDVKANLKTRTVVITVKPSRSLTLEKLWNAVEKGKGKPSRMVAFGVTYSLKRIADLSPTDAPAEGVYSIAVADLQQRQSAERVAKALHDVRGVGRVSLDAAHDALVVEPAGGAALSPWQLMAAVEQANEQPREIAGPHGRLTIERASVQVSARPTHQGTNQ